MVPAELLKPPVTLRQRPIVQGRVSVMGGGTQAGGPLEQGVVLIDEVVNDLAVPAKALHSPLHGDHLEFRFRPADHHPVQTRIDDHAAAHKAGGSVIQQLPGGSVAAHQIDSAPRHVPPGGRDDGVGLGVDTAAQLVPLAAGHLHGFPGAIAHVHAVGPAPGGAVVARRNDLVIFHDDGAVDPPQTGGPLQDGLGNIQIIVFLANAIHRQPSRRILKI